MCYFFCDDYLIGEFYVGFVIFVWLMWGCEFYFVVFGYLLLLCVIEVGVIM